MFEEKHATVAVPFTKELIETIQSDREISRLLAEKINERMIGPWHGPDLPAHLLPDAPWADNIGWESLVWDGDADEFDVFVTIGTLKDLINVAYSDGWDEAMEEME